VEALSPRLWGIAVLYIDAGGRGAYAQKYEFLAKRKPNISKLYTSIGEKAVTRNN
jgi:hypothetical protein